MILNLSQSQNLLLDSALLDADNCRHAFQLWISKVEIDYLDPGSKKLLPLLYRNLERQGIQHPLLNKLKGYYRYTWARNQILFDKLVPVLKLFQNNQIKVMLLKGASSICQYYHDPGVRVLSDIDIMVPFHQAKKACDLLTENGWLTHYPNVIPFSPLRNAINLKLDSGGEIDLHWNLLHQNCATNSSNIYWESCLTDQYRRIPIYFLSPIDNLIHTCVHGTRGDSDSLIWIPDALNILRCEKNNIVWDQVGTRGKEFQISLPLRSAFRFLLDRFNAPIPDFVFQNLEDIPTTPLEEKTYRLQVRPLGFLGGVPSLWVLYLRSSQSTLKVIQAVGFIKYLKNWYGYKNYRSLIRFFFLKALSRFMNVNRLLYQ